MGFGGGGFLTVTRIRRLKFLGSFCRAAQGGTGEFKMNGGPGPTMLLNGVDEGHDESVSSLGFFCLFVGATRTCTRLPTICYRQPAEAV